MIKTFGEAVKYLEKYIPKGEKKHPGILGLSRMKELISRIGNPQLTFPTVHVGGTSGKGSTATIIASILATKHKVGLHTSPHLVKINERIKIFSRGPLAMSARSPLIKKDIPNFEFVELVNEIKPAVERMKKGNFGAPSYFEIITALAFLYFQKQKVDIAVIEVGMGGRYDATNVINPLIAVITNIELDHTEVLGETVEKIAQDKAGIIKPRLSVVTGVKQKNIIKIMKNACDINHADLSLLKKSVLVPSHRESRSATLPVCFGCYFAYSIKKITDKGSYFDYFGINTYKNLFIPLLGEHQVENAALAIRTVEELSNKPINQLSNKPINQEDIREGLKQTFIPGRMEAVRKEPLVILDGAHNPDKVKALVKSVKSIWKGRKVTVILAIKKDKNAQEMISLLLPIADRFILTQYKLLVDYGYISSYKPDELKGIIDNINPGNETIIHKSPMSALNMAIKDATKEDIILITGSLYLVGEIKRRIL